MKKETRTVVYDDELRIEAYRFGGIMQPFSSHFHEYYVIGFVEDGERVLSCRGREYVIEKGSIVLFHPGDSHACVQSDEGTFDYRGFNISKEIMLDLAEDFFRKKNTDISVAEYSLGEELLKSNERIDILFLDIGMPGMDGIETARRLRAHGYHGFLIFITVLKEMVFQSFEVQPFDYLVKPVQEEYFERTMERLFVSMQDRLSPEKINLPMWMNLQRNFQISGIP